MNIKIMIKMRQKLTKHCYLKPKQASTINHLLFVPEKIQKNNRSYSVTIVVNH